MTKTQEEYMQWEERQERLADIEERLRDLSTQASYLADQVQEYARQEDA